ncbi:MAG: recombinase family protein [Marinomonas sp.]
MPDKKLRCAIYTRKSTEDGLKQEFNSLDAQHEACAAYALSQQHEGWALIKDRYDDGGFSGGNMERPGLKRLLADIEAGKIDIVLLYKIDRLTRSLTDFSKIVEVMDTASASFVSITQSFNTTTSMGRLTLNMLLSFAQFEREVTGERIRDKIAASKKKGIWMGGPVPLGYEVKDRKLIANEPEAEQVRHIMQRYLFLGSVPALAEELNAQGCRTKIQRRAGGPHKGGCNFRRGTLYHLLSNRIYRGMIVHKGSAYDGEHDPIVDEDLWEQVQANLKENACGSSRRKRHQYPSLLVGKLFDGEGRAMTPSHAQRGKKRYRYYVTRPEEVEGSPAWRVNAYDLERLICDRMAEEIAEPALPQTLCQSEELDARSLEQALAKADLLTANLRSGTSDKKAGLIDALVDRINLAETDITVQLNKADLMDALILPECQNDAPPISICIPAVKVRRGHQLRLIIPAENTRRNTLVQRDPKLILLLSEALAARKLIEDNSDQSIASIAEKNGRCRTRLGHLVRICCLAPDIVQSIVEGRQPSSLSAKTLARMTLPTDWNDQRKVLGIK